MMTDKLLIRPVRTCDFSEWKTLWDGYNAFYGRAGSTTLPDVITTRMWSRFFDACEPMRAFVADHSDRLLGLARLIFHRSTSSLGSIVILGLRTVVNRPAPADSAPSANGSGLGWAYASTLGLTITNPATIISFAALVAALGIGLSGGTHFHATMFGDNRRALALVRGLSPRATFQFGSGEVEADIPLRAHA